MKFDKDKHKLIVGENNRLIYFLDILIIMCILMHFGAISLTNMMAVKEMPKEGVKMGLLEVNPLTAKVEGLKLHPEYKQIIFSILSRFGFYFISVGGYFYLRLTLQTRTDLYILCVLTGVMLMITGMDFFNNLGYLIGYKLYN